MSLVDSESDVEDINRMDHSEILTVLADQEKKGSQDISPERETISAMYSLCQNMHKQEIKKQ